MLNKTMFKKELFPKLVGAILIFVIPLIGISLPLFSTPADIDPQRTAKILEYNGDHLTIDKGEIHGVKKSMMGLLWFPEQDIDGNESYVSKGLFEVIKVEEKISVVLVKNLPGDMNIKDAVKVFFEERLIAPPSSPRPPAIISTSNVKPKIPPVKKESSEEIKPVAPPQDFNREEKEDHDEIEGGSFLAVDYIRRGDAAYDASKYEEAIRLYKKALEIQADNAYAKDMLASCIEITTKKQPVKPESTKAPVIPIPGPKTSPGKRTDSIDSTHTGVLSNVIVVAAGVAGVGGAYAATSKSSTDANTNESGIEVNAENKSSYVFNIRVKTTGNWVENTLDPGNTASFKVPKSGDCTPINYTWESAGRSYTGTVNIKNNCFFSVSDDPGQSGCTLVAASVPDC